jgi:transposase
MTITSNDQGQFTVGLDVSDKHVHACFLDHGGNIVEESRLAATATALRRRFGGLERYRVVLEAGLHSPWMSRLLLELGHEIYVANPRRLRAIYENENKSDRVDAEYLARIGRLDPALLYPLRHRSPQAQADLTVLRSRRALVKARAALANYLRGVVKSAGGRIPHCDARRLAGKAGEYLPADLIPALAPIVETMADLNSRIRAYDQQIEELARTRYPETRLLRQIAGVGPITATTFVLTVEDPTRFVRARSVASYLGLRPRQDESGSSKPQLHITKAGDANLRTMLVQCCQYILGPFGPDTDLRRWGLKLAERGGKNAKKRAVVAVARKLAVLLLRLWVTGEVYEPLRMARLRGELSSA